MAETLYLSDGTQIVMLQDHQTELSNLIYERLGSEAESLFEEVIKSYTKDDGEDWEKVADGLNSLILNTIEELNAVLKNFDRKPFSQAVIKKELQLIFNNLYKNM